jgi:type IV secretory pathway VirB2 component (pilin)
MMDKMIVQLAALLKAGTDESAGEVNILKLTADEVLQNGLNIVYFLAGVVAVIVIIIAGIYYATSAGDSGKITKAKNMILYSVVGIVIILSAFAITNFVVGRF